MDQVYVDDPQLLVLASGESPAAVANARGHLFEAFVAKVLHSYGYDEPVTSNINVTSEGVELDVTATHRLTKSAAIAECKAYTTNVTAQALTSFFGKLGMERFENPGCHGFFFALPRLTNSGVEKASRLTERDSSFTYVDSRGVAEILRDLKIISEGPKGEGLHSDYAIVITPEGIFSARKQIDSFTRTATSIVVWGNASNAEVPRPAIELISNSGYAAGLPVVSLGRKAPTSGIRGEESEPPVVVEVKGSGSDFEYQLPAAPKYFVGRQKVLKELESVLTNRQGGVLVLNAQSGWGKSSLALRIKHLVEQLGGSAAVVDSRTASNADYVVHALRKIALRGQEDEVFRLPEDASFASLPSTLSTLGRAEWADPDRPMIVFFDQFENVSRDAELTAAFRDVALGIAELPVPIYLGFAWKTDLVGWTEDHPYRLRDEIRSAARVVNLPPFGAKEIDTLLNRLQKAFGEKLYSDVRQRLREYSQGLPWLFKKLAGHLLREVSNGASQAELVGEALNVKNLFEADLAQLTPAENESLKYIARYAPIPLSEVMERVTAPIMQSLIDRRLVVSVGEQIDTYWDIFRDFLNTGTVPIQETYIIRQGPRPVVRLLETVVEMGGELTLSEAATLLNVSEPAVTNIARELRLLGALIYAPNKIKVSAEMLSGSEPAETLRVRVGSILRRHRAYSIFQKLSERNSGNVAISSLAEQLPSSFPAVEVSAKTWIQYTRAFASWFEFAGLAWFDSQSLYSRDENSTRPNHSAISPRSTKDRPVFPSRSPGVIIKFIESVRGADFSQKSLPREHQKALGDLRQLHLLKSGKNVGSLAVDPSAYNEGHGVNLATMLARLREVPGLAEGLELISSDPGVSAATVGRLVNEASDGDWSKTSQLTCGRYLRGWAKVLGMKTTYPRKQDTDVER